MKGAITMTEMRTKLKMTDEFDPEELFFIIQAKIQAYIAQTTAAARPAGATSAGTKPDSQPSAPKGQINLPNLKKDTGNKNRPSNQFGRLQSPNIRNQMDSIDKFAEAIVELIVEEDEE